MNGLFITSLRLLLWQQMKFATSELFLAIPPAIQVNSFTRSHSSFVTHIHLSGLLQLSHHLSRNEGVTMLAGLIDPLSTWFQHRWVFVIRTWSCQLPRRANTTHSIIGKTFLQTPLPHPTYSSVFHHEVRLTLSTASTVHWSRNWNLMPWSCIYQKTVEFEDYTPSSRSPHPQRLRGFFTPNSGKPSFHWRLRG